jgi:hypothetical protein
MTDSLSSLIKAIIKADVKEVKYILNNTNVNVNSLIIESGLNYYDFTPLILCIMLFYLYVKYINILLYNIWGDVELDVKGKLHYGKYVHYLLLYYYSIYNQIIILLLKNGANIDLQTSDGQTVLMIFFELWLNIGYIPYPVNTTLEILLTESPDLELENKQGMTVIDILKNSPESGLKKKLFKMLYIYKSSIDDLQEQEEVYEKLIHEELDKVCKYLHQEEKYNIERQITKWKNLILKDDLDDLERRNRYAISERPKILRLVEERGGFRMRSSKSIKLSKKIRTSKKK